MPFSYPEPHLLIFPSLSNSICTVQKFFKTDWILASEGNADKVDKVGYLQRTLPIEFMNSCIANYEQLNCPVGTNLLLEGILRNLMANFYYLNGEQL